MEFDSHFDSAAVMSESFASEAFQPIEREQEFKYVPESLSEPSIDFEPSYEEEEEAKPSIESSFSSFAFSRPSPQPHSSSPSPKLRKSSTRSLSSGAPRRPSAERVSMAEYERQSKEYTQQQLRSSGLYLKHRVHFAKMNLREVVAELWRLARKMVFPALVIATVLLTLLGLYLIFSEPGLRSTSGVYMLPPSIPEPRARSGSAGGANANATAQQNATASGVLSVPQLVLDYVVSTAGEVLPTLSRGQQSADAKAGGSEAPRANYDAPVATYDPTLRVTSYIRNQTEKGMNIFTFAYTVAYDYAFSVIGRAFGWSLANDSSSSPSSSSAKGSR